MGGGRLQALRGCLQGGWGGAKDFFGGAETPTKTFISLEKGKFDFQKSLSETPFKPDGVSFCTPNFTRAHAKGVVLSAFYETLSSKDTSKNIIFHENLDRRLLRALLRSASKNPSKKRF